MSVAPINSSVRPEGRKVEMFDVEIIEIGQRLREVDPEAVERIAASMQEIGLRTPISVRYYFERPDLLPDANSTDALLLLTGAHRLAAAKKLGWQQIECIVHYDGDEVDAQLWEIAENLHRAELTKAQRDEHIRRYAELLAAKKTGDANCVGSLSDGRTAGPQHQPGVASQVAAEIGLSKDTVRRALNPQRAEAEKEKRKAERQAAQAEQERKRQEIIGQLPSETQAHIASGRPDDDGIGNTDDIEELRNIIAAQQEEIADLRRTVARYDDMAVEYERGGFENVIIGLNQRIENLKRQVERESKEKLKNLRTADYWKKKALEAGENADIVVDMDTGEMSRG